MLNEEQIKGKWSEIKGGVRNLWGTITDDELESTKGNFIQILSLIQTKYGESKETVKTKLTQLMDSFENTTDKSLEKKSQSSYERSPLEVDDGPDAHP